MPTGPNGEKRPRGTIENAVHVAKVATGEIEEDLEQKPAGKVSGGKARASAMTPEERKEMARAGARARWS